MGDGALPSALLLAITKGEMDEIMQIILSASWVLTDEHSASNEGMPVLANRETGEAYRAADTVRAYPSRGLVPAARIVDRLLGGKKQELTGEEKVFVRAFFLK